METTDSGSSSTPSPPSSSASTSPSSPLASSLPTMIHGSNFHPMYRVSAANNMTLIPSQEWPPVYYPFANPGPGHSSSHVPTSTFAPSMFPYIGHSSHASTPMFPYGGYAPPGYPHPSVFPNSHSYNHSFSRNPASTIPLKKRLHLPPKFACKESSPSSSAKKANVHKVETKRNLMKPYRKGSLIQISDGKTRKVEDMKMQDFVSCMEKETDLKLRTYKVMAIITQGNNNAWISFQADYNEEPCTMECSLEHPFFVHDKGWSACSPARCKEIYDLDVRELHVGDGIIGATNVRPPLNCIPNSQ